MPVAATARPLDPLVVGESSTRPVVSPPVAIRRGERLVPEVTTLAGADAIAVLRAGGFIAAIEPVPSELTEGTVIEQDPQAGIRLTREAVVALRLAVPQIAPPQVASQDLDPPAVHVEPAAESNDTERWFAALALSDAGRPSEPTRPRRRKHRVSPPCAHEFAFDPAPTPLLPEQQMRATESPPARRQLDMSSLLTSALYVLPSSLAGSPWRRGTALVAVLVLFALLGTRFLAASDRRQRSSNERVFVPAAHAQLAARALVQRAAPHARKAIRTTRAHHGVHPSARVAQPVLQIRRPASRPEATSPARSPDPPAAPAAAPTHAAAPSEGQFAYLGP